MENLLFLGAGPAMPNISKIYVHKFEGLSKYYKGFIITPALGKENLALKNIGKFSFNPYVFYSGNALIRNIIIVFMSIFKTFKLCMIQKKKIDVIITHAPLMIGLIAIIIGKFIRAKTIIEVNGSFEEAFKFGRLGNINISLAERVKGKIALWMTKFCISNCDIVKLLYDKQLDPLQLRSKKLIRKISFSDFVPVSEFLDYEKCDGKYILLLGYPWYLKGVDILIRAFKNISDQFPEYSLKVYGWNPNDNEYFQELAKGNDKIHLGKALEYREVIETMTNCSLYVMASRTEGIARVLIEAMASKKPIVASNVGGTSSIIVDGHNGMLFEKENVEELSKKIAMVLSNKILSDTLAENGYRYAKEIVCEEQYFLKYRNLIDSLFT